MKRSEINAAIRRAVRMAQEYRFALPAFAQWSPQEWETKDPSADEIRRAMLGWDVTDFGSGSFESVGLTAFTIRNGMEGHPLYRKPYAEKLLFADKGQKTPLHFHWNKMEDIINRGGAALCVRLYAAAPDEELDRKTPVQVSISGIVTQVPAGETLELLPGESITMTPYLYHEFWGKDGTVMLGEVSMFNDDQSDNRFYVPQQRFTAIEEDEKPEWLLCNEYPEAKKA